MLPESCATEYQFAVAAGLLVGFYLNFFKRDDIHTGVFFLFCQSIGVLFAGVGIAFWQFPAAQTAIFSPAIAAGAACMLSNLLVLLASRLVGLYPAILVWSLLSYTVAWIMARFGWFVEGVELQSSLLNVFGFIAMFFAFSALVSVRRRRVREDVSEEDNTWVSPLDDLPDSDSLTLDPTPKLTAYGSLQTQAADLQSMPFPSYLVRAQKFVLHKPHFVGVVLAGISSSSFVLGLLSIMRMSRNSIDIGWKVWNYVWVLLRLVFTNCNGIRRNRFFLFLSVLS